MNDLRRLFARCLPGLLFLLLLFAWAFTPRCCWAWENYALRTMTAYVQSIEPGNVLIVNERDKSNEKNFPVRFYGIGIPALAQPFGEQARDMIAELLPRGARILLSTTSQDGEGILSALVQRNDHSVNNMLIEQGLAWVDRSTCKAFFCRRWHIQENLAVQAKRGIWSLKLSSPPWQWGVR